MGAEAIVIGEEVAEAVLEGLLNTVGIEPIVAFFTARLPRERAQALLDAQYNTTRAEVDAEARRELPPPAPGKS